jgi:hypothetical protein
MSNLAGNPMLTEDVQCCFQEVSVGGGGEGGGLRVYPASHCLSNTSLLASALVGCLGGGRGEFHQKGASTSNRGSPGRVGRKGGRTFRSQGTGERENRGKTDR